MYVNGLLAEGGSTVMCVMELWNLCRHHFQPYNLPVVLALHSTAAPAPAGAPLQFRARLHSTPSLAHRVELAAARCPRFSPF
jgi:hypothetical protein